MRRARGTKRAAIFMTMTSMLEPLSRPCAPSTYEVCEVLRASQESRAALPCRAPLLPSLVRARAESGERGIVENLEPGALVAGTLLGEVLTGGRLDVGRHLGFQGQLLAAGNRAIEGGEPVPGAGLELRHRGLAARGERRAAEHDRVLDASIVGRLAGGAQ